MVIALPFSTIFLFGAFFVLGLRISRFTYILLIKQLPLNRIKVVSWRRNDLCIKKKPRKTICPILRRTETKILLVCIFFYLFFSYLYFVSMLNLMPNHGYNLQFLLLPLPGYSNCSRDSSRLHVNAYSSNFTVLNFSISSESLWCPQLRIHVSVANSSSSSNERNAILVYLLDPDNFIKWQRNESFSPIKTFRENEEIPESAQLLFYKHTYFLVIQNLSSKDITVNVESKLNYIDCINKFEGQTVFSAIGLTILAILGIIIILEYLGV